MIGKSIPYGRQQITEEDIQAVVEVLKSEFLTQGPKISEFELVFASYVGCQYAVAVSNGTAALHLSAIALGIKPGDKIITTPITFVASANCVRYCGGEVVFCDVNPDTYLIDVEKVRQMLESSQRGTYKGIIPVDFAGHPVNLENLQVLAREHGLWILEDACHAPGAYFRDSKNVDHYAGSAVYSDLSVFSFHPVKHVATGEGGMITTNDEKLYKLLLRLRTHGIARDHFENDMMSSDLCGDWYHEMQELGYNYRITDMQCALGISQLKRASQGLLRRSELADRYRNAFKGTAVKCQQLEDGSFHAYHLFVIHVANRKGLYDYLKKFNINAQVHYIPTHLMPYYQRLGWKYGDLPHAESYYQGCLSLPMYPTLTNDEQDFVIAKVLAFTK